LILWWFSGFKKTKKEPGGKWKKETANGKKRETRPNSKNVDHF